MVKLINADIRTKEVLQWKGLHIFHFVLSSASQKLRIYLKFKGIDWQSHPISIVSNEHLTPYYLGVNPRGLLPTMVLDGNVYIESNDILFELEQKYPKPSLIPLESQEKITKILEYENSLHLDLRTMSFRYFFPDEKTKTHQDLSRYSNSGSRTVAGMSDHDIDREIAYWTIYIDQGISDDQLRVSANRMRIAFEGVNEALAKSKYVLGNIFSVVDIAWLVFVQRLTYCGYPVEVLHPHIAIWRDELMREEYIAKELTWPKELCEMNEARNKVNGKQGKTFVDICFPQFKQ